MALSTYADLQSAVANWLHRSDLTSIIPDLITVAESRIGREVRSRYQEQRVQTTAANYISLPSDYVSMRSIWIVTSPYTMLSYLDPTAFFNQYNDTTTGRPVAYTIIGDEVRFGPDPSSAYTVEMWYYKKLTALSSSVNSLYTENPDIYLYATLAAAAPFLKDDARVALWEAEYKNVKDRLNAAHQSGRYGTGMRVVAQ